MAVEAGEIVFEDDTGEYRVVDVELTEPLAAIALQPGESGAAVVVRRRGSPIGFVPCPGRGTIGVETLARAASRAAATRILAGHIADELERERAAGERAAPAPSLTLAVCTHDRPEVLARCLDAAIAVRDAAREPGFDVLVVDNAPSDDRTAEVAARRPGVRHVCEPRPGLDFARNRALQEAGSDFVAFVDDDAIVDYGWHQGFADALAANPDAGALTGQVLPLELRTRAQIVFEAYGGFRGGFRRVRYRGQRDLENRFYPCGAGMFGAGCNMVVRRAAVLELGGFDEALDTGAPLPGGGDLDLFYRVIRAGHALVYEPRLLVFHEHRRDYAALRRQYWTWGQGLMAFLSKSYGWDRELRTRLVGLAAWWAQQQMHELAGGLTGSRRHPPDLVAAQLAGAAAGLAGTYRRSVRRVERIRRDHA